MAALTDGVQLSFDEIQDATRDVTQYATYSQTCDVLQFPLVPVHWVKQNYLSTNTMSLVLARQYSPFSSAENSLPTTFLHSRQGRNFGLKSWGTNSEAEWGVLIGPEAKVEEKEEIVSPPHLTLGSGRASRGLPMGSSRHGRSPGRKRFYCNLMSAVETDRISFSFSFSVPKKTIFFGVLFFGRKRIPHFRYFFYFSVKKIWFSAVKVAENGRTPTTRFTWNQRQAWDQPNVLHCQHCSNSWYASAKQDNVAIYNS